VGKGLAEIVDIVGIGVVAKGSGKADAAVKIGTKATVDSVDSDAPGSERSSSVSFNKLGELFIAVDVVDSRSGSTKCGIRG